MSNRFNKKEKLTSSVFGLMLQVLLLAFVFDSVVDAATIEKAQYAVIFDAGSSGTKLLAYEFSINPNGKLVLKSEKFEKVAPGLSFYKDKPEEAAESIQKLLKVAKDFVPKEFWAATPLVLKATAGLRLLGETEAEKILDVVRKELLNSGFLVKGVEIMDGADEGLFSWFTVNILMGRLDNLSFGKNTVAALDLGGGSTQVAFASKDPNSTPSLIDYIRKISTDKDAINVFSKSYEGMGLDAARAKIVESGETDDTSKTYISACVNPTVKLAEFQFGPKKYVMSGKNNSLSTEETPVVDYNACVDLIKKNLVPSIKPKPVTLNQKEIAAFSGFYWRTMLSGIVPQSGGEATVKQIVEKNKQVCASAVNEKQPFECLDLTYVTILLTDAYGLDKDTMIDFYRQFDGHEISWTLGCAYTLLSEVTWGKM